ncbi:MAG: TolC family protein, partial [Paludibacter sp.]
KQQLNSINEALKYSRERVSIAQAGFKAGSLIKSELLMAKIDLNVAMENEINQQYVIQTVRNNLNVNLAQNNNSVYEITDSIVLNYSPDKLSLLQKLNSSNTNILAFQKQIEIAQLSLKENRSLYLPQLDFKAGYYLSQSANSQGSIRNNTTIGPQVGGTLIVPIYSAGENKRKVSTAKIMVQNAQYDLRNVKLQVNTEFENAFTEFENQQQLLKIERENNSLAKENIQICLERLRLGQSTSLEVRLAQQDYVQSSTRLINFQYNLKIAETKLKQLVSTL